MPAPTFHLEIARAVGDHLVVVLADALEVFDVGVDRRVAVGRQDQPVLVEDDAGALVVVIH